MAEEINETSQFLHDSKPKEPKKEDEGIQHIDSDTTCGFWVFKSKRLQSMANENMYVLLFGITGCFIAMSFSYFNGTISTLEKRYKIATQTSSFIVIGNDISTTLFSGFLSYYAGKGHRPRWISCGLVVLAGFCLLMAVPHFIYGAGEDALLLTRQYANRGYVNATQEDLTICHTQEKICVEESGLRTPVFILFFAQFISGIGCSLFFTLGLSYMDDNIAKSKTPAMLSWSAFLRMLGPAIGYSVSSFCLRLFIDPRLDPLITKEDSRWLGAWWLGWLIFTVIMLISAFFLYLFPKELPSTRVRRLAPTTKSINEDDENNLTEASLKDMLKSVKRLARNKVFVYNTVASMLYFFGYSPYWIYTPKYIETQYQQSAATAALATGTVALGFSAAGVLISGYVISKYKPSARAMAAWNGMVDIFTVAGILCYVLIGCEDSDKATSLIPATDRCIESCHCEYVHFSPICSPDNVTYISACHAGCSEKTKDQFGRFLYSDCKCMTSVNTTNSTEGQQYATQGPCPVDCYNEFLVFLAVMCFLKFIGATGRSSNMLLALRCVSAKDKSFALGLGSVIMCLICFIPSPILFGWLIDNYCVVWGKVCGSKGNCWLYDTKSLRHSLNFLAAACIFTSSFWNIGVWYHAKDIEIFDSEEVEEPLRDVEEFNLTESPSETKQN